MKENEEKRIYAQKEEKNTQRNTENEWKVGTKKQNEEKKEK